MDECKSLNIISGFKSPDDILFRDDLKRWIADGMNFIYTVDAAPEGYEAMSAWLRSTSHSCRSKISTTPSPSSSVRR